MLPLIPTLALSFVSFIASAFVILRIVIPILPPHPLSRRVPPSEFGLPNFKSLSPADKSHIWLAACDILALSIFVWQAVSEAFGGPSLYDVTYSPLAAVRLWFALTLRQSCLLVVASLTLLHVRLGRPVSFGEKHWMLWSPTLLLIATSTALAGVLAGAGLPSFFYGLVAYSATLAVLSSVAFGCLIGTLIIIKRNIAAFNDLHDPWPPVKEVIEKPRPSFATDDVNGLKDGSSWITSRASSRQGSISAFSFSTHHSRMPSNSSSRLNHTAVASHPSIPSKSSYWFNPGTPHHGRESPIPPVPPLPAPYRPASPLLQGECDPFRRDGPRRVGSQSSWLTEPSSDQTTLSAWSFPPSRPSSPVTPRLLATHPPSPDVFNAELFRSSSRSSSTPVITSTGVLGGYGYSPGIAKAEGGSSSPASGSSDGLDVSVYRTIGWLLIIWIPFGLSLPYFLMVQPHASLPSPVISLFLILSATLSSPILACNILLRSPIPIPSGLFDSYNDPPSVVMRAPSPATTLYSREYKGSASITVVESRRSGDVWVSNGDAVDGRSKFGRALSMLSPNPKLAVLPSIKSSKDEPLTPPLPIQVEDVDQVPRTPRPENLEEMGVRRNCSEASSYMSGVDAFATQIMVAERHYSTLATTMVLPPSPDRSSSTEICATGVESSPTETKRRSGHLRVRSIPSTPGSRSPISPPPSTPLPPTPPSIKNLQASHRLTHRKSASSSVYSFGAIDTTAEIDALSAGLLPLLVPGLKFGEDMKVRNSWRSSHGNQNTTLGGMSSGFSSPDLHSTPLPMERNTRTRKVSGHKRQPHSLPLLNLDKDGATSNWRKDVDNTLEKRLEPYNPSVNDNRRNTVQFDEFGAPQYLTITVKDEDGPLRSAPAAIPNRASLGRSISMKTGDGLSPLDIPESANPARNSLVTLLSALDHEFTLVEQDNAAGPPPSANSDVTLFEFNTSTEGPQAESTPHESNKAHTRNSGVQQAPPPVPPLPAKITMEPSKRSSITYVKSDENAPPAATTMTTTTTSTTTTTTTTTKTTSSHGADKPPATIAEFSSRVRPLNTKSKTSKLPYKAKAPHSENTIVTVGGPPPKVGLRPLSLLKDRDVNQVVPRANTQPLVLGKKHQKKVVDENVGVAREDSPQHRKGLRPLKLARSETTKQRAMLREVEDLPQVVIRPPSVGSEECF